MSARLWENTPAQTFEDFYLLGNGSMGMSMDGGVPIETIQLNHDTLWSGCERSYEKPDFYPRFLEARKLTLEGKYREANDLINNELEGFWGQTYLPLAAAYLTIGQENDRRNMRLRRVLLTEEDPYTDYRRTLELRTGISETSYCRNAVKYRRRSFVSYHDQVGVVRLEATGGALSFALALDSQLRHTYQAEGNGAYLTGIAPEHAEPSYTSVKPMLVYPPDEESRALRFAAAACVAETDGELHCDGMRVYVSGASYAVVLLTTGTDYAGYRRKRSGDAQGLLQKLQSQLNQAARKGYERLLADHLADVTPLFDSFSLELGEPITEDLPTSQRLAMCAERVDDPSLCALAVQVARYLTIAGSRPGTEPLNLQGIWNAMVSPPWASNYTTNINLEMNYWPSAPFHLGQCAEPLLRLVEELAQEGRAAAKHFYHCRGWTAHHNTDLWRLAAPSCEDATWAWWPMGGLWLCMEIWNQYQYAPSEEMLKRIYPLLREAAQFALDYLVEESAGGHLVTAPSVSPENKHVNSGRGTFRQLLGQVDAHRRFSSNSPCVAAVTKAATMDICLVREVFSALCKAEEQLHPENALSDEVQEALARLPAFQIGRWGQLQEWYEDEEECMPGMGHMSHLVGVYPGHCISAEQEPEAFEGARHSLLRRSAHGGLTGGWPGAWAVCLGARLGEKSLCARTVRTIGADMGAGFLTKGSQQIDAIFGWAAGIGEMLLQSQMDSVALLPALPDSWREGSLQGLCAKGGLTFSLTWSKGRAEAGTVQAGMNHRFTLQCPGLKAVQTAARTIQAEKHTCLVTLQAGETAILLFE